MKHYNAEIKAEVLLRLDNGETVANIANDTAITPQTILKWRRERLRADAENSERLPVPGQSPN